ncbi:MAG: lamin tail domain-containing protein, partial [Chloroflexota bacterium]
MKVLKLSVQLTAVFLFILAAFVSQNVVAATAVFVNELHYDNSGADTGEAIEVAGPAGTDLAGWSIALYNGSNGTVYATVALSGVFADQNGGCGTLSFDHAGIQNGAPDGLALVDASDTVIQFLSYEGELTATDGPAAGMTSSDIGVSEAPSTPEGESLQLIGSGGMDTDFAWNAPAAASFGSVNAGQTFSCAGGDAAPTVSSSTPSNGATGVALDADVVINFSEDVTATDPWVAIECDMSGAHTTAVTGGPQSYTVNPDTDFVHGESCTVTITGSQVADNDSEDPPDTMASDVTISFETETVPVEADLVINEINADPDTELGDANGDGAAHFSDDEFVEIVNNSGSTVDLSGWTLADGFGVRHMFPAETVVPHGCAVVVFGGGTPTGEFGGAIVQTASDGALGLNNGGDSVVLNDGAADQAMATYGAEGGGNQSLTLSPDVVGTPPYVLHSEAAGSGGTLFSPGTAVDATPFASCTGAPADPNLLLSEIVVTPTGGEFVEILNPTSSPIDLSNVYLTDATFAGGSTYYYNIVTGSNAGGGGFGDFHARFPAGAMIGAGEYQTVAIAGSAAFATEYGQEPTYELYEDGEAADAIPDMVEALPGSINNQGGLTNGGEIVILYSWDGAADLVTDHDYVVWGDKAEAVDKTGVSVDGPDADSDVSAYQNDTAITDQDPIALDGHAFGNAWQREDNAEGAEIKSGGNGANGHDETSEDTSATWCESAPTPNGATVCGSLVVSEIMFDPASSESTWEWVEVYNGRSDAVDVAGYVLDNGDMTALGAANVAAGMIGAGETAVFFNADTLTANDFASAWGPGNYIAVSNWAELTNTGDQIGLWDSFASYSGDNETQANTVAQVSYMNAAPWPVNNDAASIFLTDLAADANDGANWSLSMVDGQTPAFTGFMSAAAGGNSGADIGSPSAGLPSVCGDPATPIHFIQGTGLASSEVGNVHTIEGVVVG